MEEDRTPVGRLDFKSSEGRSTSLVGSTPTLFRQPSNKTKCNTRKTLNMGGAGRICWWNLSMKALTLARGPSQPMPCKHPHPTNDRGQWNR